MDQTMPNHDGARLRDAAIDRIERGARVSSPETWSRALSAVRAVCSAHPERRFTSDDVWRALSDDDLGDVDPRVMGAVLRHAQRQGWCIATHAWRLSDRPVCHRRPVRVWMGSAP